MRSLTRFERIADRLILLAQGKGAGWSGPYAALAASEARAHGFKATAASWQRRAIRAEFRCDDFVAYLLGGADTLAEMLVEPQLSAADGPTRRSRPH